MSRSTKIIGYAFIVAFLLVVVEFISFAFFAFLPSEKLKRRLYEPPRITDAEFESYMRNRDALLGWPSKELLASTTAADGTRRSPANTALAERPVCVSLYGDSYTFSSEVNHDEAWGDVLAERLGCRVANYGISGYGTDQAVLRFEYNVEDAAKTVLLGIFAEDLNRNMNQWRYLLDSHSAFSFKPIFSINPDDTLELHPVPVETRADVEAIYSDPERHLKHETYPPDGEYMRSRMTVSFPYTLSAIRLAMKIADEIDWSKVMIGGDIRNWNHPAWYDTPEGPLERKIRLNTLIVQRFQDLCEQRKRHCAVIIMPGKDSIFSVRDGGPNLMQPVIDPIREIVDVWDPTAYFAEHTIDKGLCFYIGIARDCGGHYNADGYRLLAEFVEKQLAANGLAPPRPGS